MRVMPCKVGARGFDSLQFSRSESATGPTTMLLSGLSFFVGYLGICSPKTVTAAVEAGLGFMPVTLADEYDTPEAVLALGLPPGVTVWLDLEGLSAFHADSKTLEAKINAWADAMTQAGYQPGLYVGSPQPFTSDELFALHTVRYWKGQGSTRDRFGDLAEPRCGWCMHQAFPQTVWENKGVLVDIDLVEQDYFKRLPSMAVK
jgi:hypothetical protein